MHDPMVVAFEVRRPWPRISKLKREHRGPRTFLGAFWRFGDIELYWPAVITVWHVEPGGEDSGTVCNWKTSRWKWHVHHWRLQFLPWQRFYRWAFTRCAGCGGPSRRGRVVNVSMGWSGSRKPERWWQGRQGVYHGECTPNLSRPIHADGSTDA